MFNDQVQSQYLRTFMLMLRNQIESIASNEVRTNTLGTMIRLVTYTDALLTWRPSGAAWKNLHALPSFYMSVCVFFCIHIQIMHRK